MRTSKMFTVVKILAVVGTILSIYLLVEQIFKPTFRPCTINSVVNCDAVIDGPIAKTLGLPTPLYGLIGYIVIFIAAMLRKTKLILGMATFGLLFCLWIAYKELYELRVICPVCIGCQIDMIAVFILAIRLVRHSGTTQA